MSTTNLPDRRTLYFLNTTPPPVLTQAALAAMDADPEGIELVQAIHPAAAWKPKRSQPDATK